jgi:hypothetical protein
MLLGLLVFEVEEEVRVDCEVAEVVLWVGDVAEGEEAVGVVCRLRGAIAVVRCSRAKELDEDNVVEMRTGEMFYDARYLVHGPQVVSYFHPQVAAASELHLHQPQTFSFIFAFQLKWCEIV